jgi:electron transfer flavoprotein alpha subunit
VTKAVLSIAETLEDKVKPVTYEVAACAAKHAALLEADLFIAVLGENPSKLAHEIAEHSGQRVIVVKAPELAQYSAEFFKSALTELSDAMKPSSVFIAQTAEGSDFAPGLAIRLEAACISGVRGISREDKGRGALFSRSLFGSKLVADLHANTKTVVATVEPGAFQPLLAPPKAEVSVSVKTVSLTFSPRTRVRGIEQSTMDHSELSRAQIVISGGRGMSKPENTALLERLGTLFSRAAIGGSRPVCDLRWLKPSQQVGQTGTIISPKLYLACGISGASQHVAGIRGSDFIVAINKDAHAPIFNHADVGIVEDLETFIPVMIEESAKG